MRDIQELLKTRMATGSIPAFVEEENQEDNGKDIEIIQELGDCGLCSMYC